MLYITQENPEKFLLYYQKAVHVIEPPTRDCYWEVKSDWKLLNMMGTCYLSLFYCKAGNFEKAIETVHVISEPVLRTLELAEKYAFVLANLYLGVGMLA